MAGEGFWKREHTAIAVAGAAAGAAAGLGGAYLLTTAAGRRLHAMTNFMFNVTGNQSAPTTLDYLEAAPGSTETIMHRLGQRGAFALLTDDSTAPAGQTPPVVSVPVPSLGPATGASVGIVYSDERALAAAAGGGILNRAVRLLVWDYEDWPHTPADQVVDPQTYAELGAYAAHRHGYTFAAAPSPNIMRQILSQPQMGYASAFGAFIASGQVEAAAQYADIAVCQAQVFEGSLQSYAAAVQQFALRARLANSNVAVWATLSVAPGGGNGYSVEYLYSLMAAVALTVDGFWLLLPVTDKDQPGERLARAATLVNLLAGL
jgi:hypothetical protein